MVSTKLIYSKFDDRLINITKSVLSRKNVNLVQNNKDIQIYLDNALNYRKKEILYEPLKINGFGDGLL